MGAMATGCLSGPRFRAGRPRRARVLGAPVVRQAKNVKVIAPFPASPTRIALPERGGSMLFAAVLLQAASAGPPPAGRAWATCLIERGAALSRSPDPSETIADAVMTLCSDQEDSAHAEMRELIVTRALEEGRAASRQAAERLVDGAAPEAHAEMHKKMRAYVLAIVVQRRARPAPAR